MKLFDVDLTPTIEEDVEIPVPGQPSIKVKFEFKRLEENDLEQLLKDIRGDVITAKKAIRDVVVGWTSPGPGFSAEALEACFQTFPGSPKAIFSAFRNAHYEARQKN